MKKIIALVLCLLLVFSLVACGSGSSDSGKTDDSTKPADTSADTEKKDDAAPADNNGDGKKADSSSSAFGDDSQEEIVNEVDVGLYNPDYDYFANPKYKVTYYILSTGVLYEEQGKGIEHWCKVCNCEYGGLVAAGGDKDAYLSNLTTLAQANDGLILDPDAEQMGRIKEILDEAKTPWMNIMGDPRDYSQDGKMVHPYVGFRQIQVGRMMGPQLLSIKEEKWPDVPIDQFGFICVDMTISPVLHERCEGFRQSLEEVDPSFLDRFYIADCSIASFDVDTSNTVVSAILAEHPEIEYWLIFGEIDDMCMGAAAALENVGLEDQGACVTFGGTALQNQWDSGVTSAWVAACYLPPVIYNEPIFGALYLFMQGEMTPEEIWPEWKDEAEPEYAKRMLPAFWIYQENYQHMIEWADVYAGSDFYPYDSTGITRNDFTTHVDVPASYNDGDMTN